MTSLSLLLAVVAEEARGVGGGVGGAATLTPLGQVRDPGRGLCRCMIDYNFDETDAFRER